MGGDERALGLTRHKISDGETRATRHASESVDGKHAKGSARARRLAPSPG